MLWEALPDLAAWRLVETDMMPDHFVSEGPEFPESDVDSMADDDYGPSNDEDND